MRNIQADDEKQLEDALEAAFEAGYRHFDTAPLYKNEHVLGRVLRRWLDGRRVKREELFIVTKVIILEEDFGEFDFLTRLYFLCALNMISIL